MMSSLKDAKDQHAPAVLSLPDVITIGIGKNTGKNSTIIVGMKKVNPVSEEEIRKVFAGYPLEFQLMGILKIQ